MANDWFSLISRLKFCVKNLFAYWLLFRAIQQGGGASVYLCILNTFAVRILILTSLGANVLDWDTVARLMQPKKI